MENKTYNFESHKEIKKLKRIQSDLQKIQALLGLIIQGLGVYKKYTPVKSIIASIVENKALIGIYLKKVSSELEEKNDKPNV